MCSPRSYTGDDVLELHCHGGQLILERVITICLHQGCRPARPGEFTLRAFLNGKIDLVQAEAVADIVRARTNAGLDIAVRQLAGWLSERVEPIRSALAGILAHMEASVDFVEDDIPPQLDAATVDRLTDALVGMRSLLEGAEQGMVLREGATLAIVGSPNVGKSSIMNALLGMDRSIVTPVAGTTRDTVEETLHVRGISFRTIDTAGITSTDDLVEGMGVQRSRRAIEAADVVLLVLDRSRQFSHHDAMAADALREACTTRQAEGRPPRTVVALNKADLPSRLDPAPLGGLCPTATVETSAIVQGGVDALRAALEDAALGGERHEMVVTNVRHQDALRRSANAITDVLTGFKTGIPLDLLSFDVRRAAQALGEITGTNVDDELLDRIFSEFCIGK
jgi:tRNA modification GTPase